MNNKIWGILLIVLRMAIAVIVSLYFWNNDSFESVKFIPIYILILCSIYIALQIARRYFLKTNYWHDWLYYISLCTILIPVLLCNQQNVGTMDLIEDIGVVFLIIPLILEGNESLKAKN